MLSRNLKIITLSLLLLFFLLFAINFKILAICLLLFLVGYCANKLLKRKIGIVNRDIIDFMHDVRRNFDKLIIGDEIKSARENLSNSLCFMHSGRTLFASYLYLIHFYSYLREDGDGKVYIYFSNKTRNKMYVSIFDILVFHRVVRMRFKASSILIDRYPLLFYFKKFRNEHYFVDKREMPIEDRIQEFCKLRNIKVKLIKK